MLLVAINTIAWARRFPPQRTGEQEEAVSGKAQSRGSMEDGDSMHCASLAALAHLNDTG